MSGDHIKHHGINLYFDAISAVCYKREGVLGLQCDITDEFGQHLRLLLSFEGEAAPNLKRAIDRVFARYPEMRAWK